MFMMVWMCAAATAFLPTVERPAPRPAEFVPEHTQTVTQRPREIMSLGWADEDEVAHF